MERSQVSMEYVMIIGLLILITIPLFVYSFVEVKRNIQMNYASDAINTIANAADTVYSLGPGSKKYVRVMIPGGVIQTLVNDTEISMILRIYGGESDVFEETKQTVIGSIPADEGSHRIAVESLSSGVVRIGESLEDNEPPNITRIYPDVEEGEVLCPGLIMIGADTDEPAMCRYDTEKEENYYDWEFEFEGRSLSHYKTLYLVQGFYTYYARCIDYNDNVMSNDNAAEITFEVGLPCGAEGTGNLTFNLSDDIGPPEVHLISPPDGYVKNFSWVDLTYTVSDTNNSIEYCLLVAGGVNYAGNDRVYFSWDQYVLQNITNNMTLLIEKGNYTWYVNCTDDSTNHNTGQSDEIWDLEVTKTFYESFLNSCAGECGFAGYIDGFCRENSAQCTNKDEINLPAADEKCLSNNQGDPSRDTCCCVPG